jgi:hypothetical protein
VGAISGAALAAGAAISLVAAGAARAAMSDTGLVTRRGMAKFIKVRARLRTQPRAKPHACATPQNEVESSIEDFDLVMKLDPRQRPCALPAQPVVAARG